jgi:membrane-bound inhibitor of C-type lysozyme
MMKWILGAASAVTLPACQTPCPPVDTGPVSLGYECADGSTLQVTFSRSPDTAVVRQEGYSEIQLPLQSSAVGFRYSEGGTELQGRRSEVHWTRPGAAETVCRETS